MELFEINVFKIDLYDPFHRVNSIGQESDQPLEGKFRIPPCEAILV